MCWLVSVFPFLTMKQWGYKIYQLNLANSCTLLKTYKIHKNEIENNRNDYSLGQKLGHNGHNRCSAKCDVAPKIWNWVDAVRQCIQCNNNCWEFTRHKNNNCHRSGLFKPHERMTWDREKRSKKKCPTEHSIRYLFIYEMPHHAKNTVQNINSGEAGIFKDSKLWKIRFKHFPSSTCFYTCRKYFYTFQPQCNLI